MSGARPEAPRSTWWDALWRRFWTLPAVIASASVLLGLTVPLLDESLGSPLPGIFEGGTSGARSVLATISGAMISVTGLVFSITMVILQLASSQFTPRILGTFLDSRVTQVTLGVFTGSFLYSLSVLRAVRGAEDVPVPETAVAFSYVYVVVAVAMFLAFIHHITNSVQVAQVMTAVRRRTVATMERTHATEPGHRPGWSPSPDTPRMPLVLDDRVGYVTTVDSTFLVRSAASLDVVVELQLAIGDHVVGGQPVGRVWGRDQLADDEAATLLSSLHISDERAHLNDLGFGIRQLVDIAERALSPGINDPTTAIQAINQLHAVLRSMASRPDPTPYLYDDEDTVRAIYRPQTYAQELRASMDELSHYGRESLRVTPHLRVILDDLALAARPEHAAVTRAVRQQLAGEPSSTAT